MYENIPIAKAENYAVNCQENQNALPAYRITEVDILTENTTAIKEGVFFTFSEPGQLIIGANKLGNQVAKGISGPLEALGERFKMFA